ncbi:Ribonuclease Y [hydrothermal vent metagenome]|uniref:Ribonuclease Y n=1 Tax=hydrothermal vent metagenome TaxID=652676 RepID=A0A3B0VKJ7_9ZZZZ
MQTVIVVLAAIIAGIGLGVVVHKKMSLASKEDADAQARKMVEDALAEAERIKQDAILHIKEESFNRKQELDKELRLRGADLQKDEKKISQRLEQIERKIDLLDKREVDILNKEKSFARQESSLAHRRKEIDRLIAEQQNKLETIAGISKEEAQKRLIESIASEARMEAAKEVVRIENEMKMQADRKAKNILALAMSRYAGDYVAERAVSIVPLPNEEMKGRIIGREGRNIRAIEAATGIDIIIDDTPEAVILSGFNPVRREVARQAMERLIADGRIHPARIEEIVEKVSKELDVTMREAGEQATFDVGVHGVHPEVIMLLGRLKYRTSYGQNVLVHSLEVAFLCGIMAAELGLDVKQAKRAGLLHDIGKAVDHEVEGSHAIIGRDLARKYKESPEVVQAIGAHHEDIEAVNVLDILVQSADALSGARPGARKEMLESYVKRLEDLEDLANSFKGVEKSFAIQAGREVRVIVNSSEVKDMETTMLGKDIAKKIEENLTYPGQIRVTVIRETRSVEYAK